MCITAKVLKEVNSVCSTLQALTDAEKAGIATLVKGLFADEVFMTNSPEPGWAVIEEIKKYLPKLKGISLGDDENGGTDWESYITLTAERWLLQLPECQIRINLPTHEEHTRSPD